jgi:hypothetical protein
MSVNIILGCINYHSWRRNPLCFRRTLTNEKFEILQFPSEQIVLGHQEEILLKPKGKEDKEIRSKCYTRAPFLNLHKRRAADACTFRDYGGTQLTAQAGEFDLLADKG